MKKQALCWFALAAGSFISVGVASPVTSPDGHGVAFRYFFPETDATVHKLKVLN